MIHQTTLLHGLSTLRGYWACAKINRRLWFMDETLKWSYHCWWRLVAIGILKRGIMLSHRIERVCLLGWSKGHVIIKSMATIIPLVEFSIYFSELEYIIMSGICNSRIWKVILIGDNTTLLYYKHQFRGSLHAMDSRSWTRTLGVSL